MEDIYDYRKSTRAIYNTATGSTRYLHDLFAFLTERWRGILKKNKIVVRRKLRQFGEYYKIPRSRQLNKNGQYILE